MKLRSKAANNGFGENAGLTQRNINFCFAFVLQLSGRRNFTQQKNFPLLCNVSPKALCLAEDIAACLVEKLNMVLLNKIPKVQVSDTTGDAMKNKSWYHKNPVWPTSRILIIKFIKYRSFICVSAAGYKKNLLLLIERLNIPVQ